MEPSAGKNSPANRGQPVELLCVRPASGRFEKYALERSSRREEKAFVAEKTEA